MSIHAYNISTMATTIQTSPTSSGNDTKNGLPDFATTYAEVSPIIPVLHRALEYGCGRGKEFFDNEKCARDPFLFPDLVRFFGKRFLQSEGVNAEERDFEMHNLANNGLSILFADYHIRVLKADNGSVPTPGVSKKKADFYNQQMSLLPDVTGTLKQTKLNIIALWDVDANGNLSGLWLACTRSGGQTKDSVELHWLESLPHPAEVAGAVVETIDTTVDDLPMTLKQEESGRASTK